MYYSDLFSSNGENQTFAKVIMLTRDGDVKKKIMNETLFQTVGIVIFPSYNGSYYDVVNCGGVINVVMFTHFELCKTSKNVCAC